MARGDSAGGSAAGVRAGGTAGGKAGGRNGGRGAAVAPPEGDLSQFRGHPVQLEAFEGPLDLLLHLIKKDRIEIWQISISRITRQYLQYLSTLTALNIEVAGEFLVMAATLMRIKSQNLLPRPSFLPEEDEAGEPLTREDLIARLVEYRKYREAAQAMAALETRQSRMFPRGSVAALEPGARLPLREPKLFDLAEYLHELLDRKEPVAGHQVHLEEFRLEDQMDWVLNCLETAPMEPERAETEPAETVALEMQEGARAVRFARLLRQAGARLEVVVTFLAVLELARLQRLRIWQRLALHEIWITARARLDAGPPGPETGSNGETAMEPGATTEAHTGTTAGMENGFPSGMGTAGMEAGPVASEAGGSDTTPAPGKETR